jgi:hypothetical protein
MKKDVYPDVRIEIISEGLTKKILESSESPAPAVYGEEQPEGKNLPNVSIKGKNKELQSVLETSNKKPTYTGLVKEAIQELRKDGHDKIAYGTPKPMIGIGVNPSYSVESPEFGSREIDSSKTVSIAPGTKDEQKFEGERMSDTPDSPQDYKGDTQRLLTEGGFGRGVSEDYKAGGKYANYSLPVIAAGKVRDKQISSTLTPEQREKGAASIGSGRLEEAMVKEAVQELRKSKKKVSELSKDNGPMVGAQPPLTTTDVISNVNQAVNSGRSLDAGTVKEITDNPQKYQTQLTSLFDKGTQEQKLQVGFGAAGSALGRAAGAGYTPPKPEAGLPTLDQTLATKVPTTSEAGPAPASTPGPSILGEPGAGGLGTPRPEGGPSDTVVLDPKTQGATAPDNRFKDSELGRGSFSNKPLLELPQGGTSESVKPPPGGNGEKNPLENVDSSIASELGKLKDGFSSTSLSPEILRPKGTGNKDLPEFQSSGYFSTVLALGNLNDPSVTDEQKKTAMENYGLTGLSSDGSSISPLSEFLSLYAQNESQFDQTKFLDNIGEVNKADLEKADIKNPFRAALKKQAPPMAMTMNRPPNMGVGVQQPVVTGAGTMKNTEKAVAANKPAATPARTKARRTVAGSIEQRKEKAYIARQAQKALIKSGMVWDQINKQWVPMSKG